MDDGPDIGSVDPHAKGVGRDDEWHAAIHEGVLRGGTIGRAHPAVIRDRRDAFLPQQCVNLLDVLHRRRVDDGSTLHPPNNVYQLSLLVGVVGDGTHEVGQIGTMRARVHNVQLPQVQLLGDVVDHL